MENILKGKQNKSISQILLFCNKFATDDEINYTDDKTWKEKTNHSVKF